MCVLWGISTINGKDRNGRGKQQLANRNRSLIVRLIRDQTLHRSKISSEKCLKSPRTICLTTEAKSVAFQRVQRPSSPLMSTADSEDRSEISYLSDRKEFEQSS